MPSIRDSLALMLGLAGYSTRLFADAESFLVAFDPAWAGCVVADLRLPGLSGVELQAQCARSAAARSRSSSSPRTATCRPRAPRSAPRRSTSSRSRSTTPSCAARSIRRSRWRASASAGAELRRADAAKLARLTPREREVLEHAVNGLHAKEIAAALGISPRTVEVHKTRIMEKLEVRNIAELVRFRFR